MRPPQSGVATRAQEIAAKVGIDRDVVGVEVGVFAGDLSRCLLELMPRLTLWMVDSWAVPGAGEYGSSADPHAQCSQEEHDGYYNEALEKVGRFGARARIIREPSLVAAGMFAPMSLDFVFLDADHTYEAVRADLLAWSPKVKFAGLLCGHDYANTGGPYQGVQQAVDAWVGSRAFAKGYDMTWFAVMR